MYRYSTESESTHTQPPLSMGKKRSTERSQKFKAQRDAATAATASNDDNSDLSRALAAVRAEADNKRDAALNQIRNNPIHGWQRAGEKTVQAAGPPDASSAAWAAAAQFWAQGQSLWGQPQPAAAQQVQGAPLFQSSVAPLPPRQDAPTASTGPRPVEAANATSPDWSSDSVWDVNARSTSSSAAPQSSRLPDTRPREGGPIPGPSRPREDAWQGRPANVGSTDEGQPLFERKYGSPPPPPPKNMNEMYAFDVPAAPAPPSFRAPAQRQPAPPGPPLFESARSSQMRDWEVMRGRHNMEDTWRRQMGQRERGSSPVRPQEMDLLSRSKEMNAEVDAAIKSLKRRGYDIKLAPKPKKTVVSEVIRFFS